MNLVGPTGELRFTIEIKRKETGKVEQFELVGQVTDEQLKEIQYGGHTLDGSEKRSD
jgi:hypothetical protein